MIKVGERLKELREQKGLSFRQLAEKTEPRMWGARETGISHTQIADIETGSTNPSIDTLERILDALGVTLAQFFQSPSPQPCPHPKHAELVQRFIYILHSKTELAHATEVNTQIMYKELLRRAKNK